LLNFYFRFQPSKNWIYEDANFWIQSGATNFGHRKKAKNKFLVFTKTMSLMLTFKISAYSVLLIFET
jgi:hypothetical protein